MTGEELYTKAARIFNKAADYIRQYGWQESGMSEHGKARCSMGALQSAGEDKVWDKNLSALMYESLHDKLNGTSLTEFNAQHKNGESVAKLFEATASYLVNDKAH